MDLEKLKRDRDAAKFIATDDLRVYTRLMWPVIEPKEKFVWGWHIDAIAEHLMAVSRGEIRNLIISVPPRHMKSIEVGVMWPSWDWLKNPAKRWIYGAYAKSLSVRDSIKCRNVIQSWLYQETFKPTWQLSDDQNQKLRFNNTATGYRIATSVDGTGTGEGGDVIVVDDPMKATDAESETMRENVINWWDQEMSTRGNNPETAARVIIMQRLHSKDLAGHCAQQGGYDILRLPAEYDDKKTITSIGWEDPRRTKGELLWPQRFTKEALEPLKKKLGSRGTAAQLQQDPKASEDGLFKRKWWKFYKQPPARGQFLRVFQFWDSAQKPGISNDNSVCATWGQTTSGFYLLDLWKGKVEYPQLIITAKLLFNKWTPNAIVVEDKGSGISLIQDLRQNTTIPVLAYDPGQRDKQVRAAAATPAVESGNCFLPEDHPEIEDFIREHEQFPDGDHDDQVDTTSQMVEYFSRQTIAQPRVRRL